MSGHLKRGNRCNWAAHKALDVFLTEDSLMCPDGMTGSFCLWDANLHLDSEAVNEKFVI